MNPCESIYTLPEGFTDQSLGALYSVIEQHCLKEWIWSAGVILLHLCNDSIVNENNREKKVRENKNLEIAFRKW